MPSLPKPADGVPLVELLRNRRSTKAYAGHRLTVDLVGDLLWAAAGRTDGPRRTVGSAHALYPVVTTLVAGAVADLPSGAYRYRSEDHDLDPVEYGDHRLSLAATTLDASWLSTCPVVLLLSADLDRANAHFADQGARRGEHFALIEAGAISQNVHLWAAVHALGTVFIGGLREVESALVPAGHQTLGLLPVGRPAPSSIPGGGA